MGIGRIFDISSRSLATYQRALDVTSNNVANSANPDYSRQRINFQSENPDIAGGFAWGAGVKIDQVKRVRNSLIDAQLRTSTQSYSANNKLSLLLGHIEQVFSEPNGSGLGDSLSSFFNAFNELSVTPNSIPLRYNILQAASNLSNKVGTLYEDLDVVKGDTLAEMHAQVSTLNQSLKVIAQLNSQIFSSQAAGNPANELLDKRDKLLADLSDTANINVNIDENNIANVSVGGVFGAGKSTSTEFKVAQVDGKVSVVSADGNMTVKLTGGELSALQDVYSKKIPEYKNSIDQIMNTLVEKVNEQHSKGFSISNPPETGIKFFDSYKDGSLKINGDFQKDPNLIAVSADGTNGNGDIALAISDLSNEKILNGLKLTEAYSTLVSKVGSEKASAEQMSDSTQLVLQNLEQQKDSYSGVSVDEEMTNIIKFQRSYDASAKLIKIADEMLQTLLQMV